jgi:hypothetical protein
MPLKPGMRRALKRALIAFNESQRSHDEPADVYVQKMLATETPPPALPVVVAGSCPTCGRTHKRKIKKTIVRDDDGLIAYVLEEDVDDATELESGAV